MKKKIALLLCMAVLTIAFTACGKDKIVGTWEVDAMTIDGVLMDFDEIIDTYADSVGSISLEFEKDGTCVFYIFSAYYGSETQYGTWEKTGSGTYTIYIEGDPVYASFEGKKLVMDDGYDLMYFTRG